MRILITGHRGFIGQHLWNAVLEKFLGVALYGLDRQDGNDIQFVKLPPDMDLVFHLAAQTDAFNNSWMENLEDNILATDRILETYGNKVVHASTSMVNYPVNPYAITKRTAEDMALYYGAQVVRLCNIYGEGGHSVIDKFRGSSVLTIYGEGNQLRTYAPVEAAVSALLGAAAIVGLGPHLQVLHGKNMSVNEVALMFPGRHKEYIFPARPGDILNGVQR